MKGFVEKYYAWIPLLLLCTLYMYLAVDFEIHDFSNYYFGGYFLGSTNFTSDIYFPYWFNKEITALGNPPLFAGFAPNSPFLALLFYPLTFLSLATAKLAFNCISVLLFLYSLCRLVAFYKIKPIYVLSIPLLFLVPIKNSLLFGQVYFLLFFFLSESWLAYEKKQFRKTAVFMSMAILLKVFPLLLMIAFLFKKQYKLFLYTVLSCLLLAAVTTIFCGFDVWFFYIQNVLTKASNGGIASAYIVNYQSVFMFLKELLVYDVTENPNAFFNQPVLFSGLLMAFKIGLVVIGFYISKKVADSLFVFSYWILAMILISPYGSTYTFILLLFPFIAIAKSEIPVIKKMTLLMFLFLVNNLLLRFFTENRFPLSYLRLFALLIFFMLLLSLLYKAVNWRMVSLISIVTLISILFLKQKEPIQSVYLLQKDSPLLVYDYIIAHNKLTYFYWNEKGENRGTISFPASNPAAVDLKDNQVYYNKKQLTFDNSNKRKPMLINGKTIIYLSDYDRGIGFYTLRKIVIH